LPRKTHWQKIRDFLNALGMVKAPGRGWKRITEPEKRRGTIRHSSGVTYEMGKFGERKIDIL